MDTKYGADGAERQYGPDTDKRIVSHAHADIVPGTVYLTPEGISLLDFF
jgi:hypothetical protein